MNTTRQQERPRTSRRARQAGLAAALFCLCLPLQGCFTTGLWASGIDSRGKAGLTPLAVTLDVITFPAQVAVFHGDHHHHHGRRGRCR